MTNTIISLEKLLSSMQEDFYVIKTAHSTEIKKKAFASLGEKSDELSKMIQFYLKFGEES